MATHSAQLANLLLGTPASAAVKRVRTAEGLAYARAWRIANRPFFDALYGAA